MASTQCLVFSPQADMSNGYPHSANTKRQIYLHELHEAVNPEGPLRGAIQLRARVALGSCTVDSWHRWKDEKSGLSQ